MEDRAEKLRRRIAIYRRYLEEGVDSDLASYYLREILSAEKELEREREVERITEKKRR